MRRAVALQLRAGLATAALAGAATGAVLLVPQASSAASDGDSQSPTGTPTETTPSTHPTYTTPPPPSTVNLSLADNARADGSGEAAGTSYGNVRDGDMSTYWSPIGSTGSISITWRSAKAVSRVMIREVLGAPTAFTMGYQVVNGDTGAVLASGSGVTSDGWTFPVTFPQTTLKKITFTITSAYGTPRVGEFETYSR